MIIAFFFGIPNNVRQSVLTELFNRPKGEKYTQYLKRVAKVEAMTEEEKQLIRSKETYTMIVRADRNQRRKARKLKLK